MRSPQRNLPFAHFIGIGILIFLYLSANFAFHAVLSMEEMRAAGDHAPKQLLHKLVGPLGMAAITAVIMCSSFWQIAR